MSRAISPYCRNHWRVISCAFAISIQSRVHCWRRPRRETFASRRLRMISISALTSRAIACSAMASLIDEPRDIRSSLARRPCRVRAWLLILLRGGADRGRHRASPHDLRCDSADVSHVHPDCAGGPVPWPSCRVHAADDARECYSRHSDHHALSGCAWRTRAYRQAGADRHLRPDEAGLWRRGADQRDEIPVFWACGVTPQSVVAMAKPEFCITHYPGCMLVTDRRNAEFAIM